VKMSEREDYSDLLRDMHQNGINCRHLGLVRYILTFFSLFIFLIIFLDFIVEDQLFIFWSSE
jgi:hypothetical protein